MGNLAEWLMVFALWMISGNLTDIVRELKRKNDAE